MFRISYNLCHGVRKINNISSIISKKLINSPIAPISSKISNSFSINYCTNKNVQKEVSKSEHIYYGTLKNQVISVKIFSLTSSMIGLAFQPVLYNKFVEFGTTPIVLGFASILGFFTFVTPLLLHFISKKYVTDIDYNHETKKYTATLYTFFVMKKKIEFTPEDVHVPDILGMFTTMHIKNTPVFIDLVYFKDPTHYAKIMGYDKPIPFKLEREVIDEKEVGK